MALSMDFKIPLPDISGLLESLTLERSLATDLCILCDGNFTATNSLLGLTNNTIDTCGDYAAIIAFVDNSTQCAERNNPVIRAACECEIDENTCNLCDGNVPNLSLSVTSGITCQQGVFFTAANSQNQSECNDYNAVIGAACNCPGVPTPSCDVLDKCPQGKIFSFAADFNSDKVCGEVLLESSLGTVPCNEQELIGKCCVNKTSEGSKDVEEPTSSSFLPQFFFVSTFFYAFMVI